MLQFDKPIKYYYVNVNVNLKTQKMIET